METAPKIHESTIAKIVFSFMNQTPFLDIQDNPILDRITILERYSDEKTMKMGFNGHLWQVTGMRDNLIETWIVHTNRLTYGKHHQDTRRSP